MFQRLRVLYPIRFLSYFFINRRRMMFENLLSERIHIDMCVYFGSSDALMAEQSLYDAQICAAFEQCRSKGMAQHMRCNFL